MEEVFWNVYTPLNGNRPYSPPPPPCPPPRLRPRRRRRRRPQPPPPPPPLLRCPLPLPNRPPCPHLCVLSLYINIYATI